MNNFIVYANVSHLAVYERGISEKTNISLNAQF